MFLYLISGDDIELKNVLNKKKKMNKRWNLHFPGCEKHLYVLDWMDSENFVWVIDYSAQKQQAVSFRDGGRHVEFDYWRGVSTTRRQFP